MGKSIRQDKFEALRGEFPSFTYEDFAYDLSAEGLKGSFRFLLGDRYAFTPSFFIPRKPFFLPDEEIRPCLSALIFHIGLIELISYWKAACPPEVFVKAGPLSATQAEWWKALYFNGLGEFFYLNGICTDAHSFMNVRHTEGEGVKMQAPGTGAGTIIPVGGGKDSVVTLGLLGKLDGSLPLLLNPTRAALDCVKMSGRDEGSVIEIRRNLDPLLLELNGQGFLNGHTPFSALLAFYALLGAVVSGRQYIALSNESSANEPTIPGTGINHQYSKSFAFETGFQDYLGRWLSGEIVYFSFLRPLNELRIAQLFSGFTAYHPVFRSCNAGSKTNAWCGKCPKCLFTRLILAPFLPEPYLDQLFGRKLLEDPELALYFDQLTGQADEKPFDCVGTIGEVNAAVREAIRKHGSHSLPFLLERYAGQHPGNGDEKDLRHFLDSFDPRHAIPSSFLDILKQAADG